MPKIASPAVRAALIRRGAELLAARQPVTARTLVQGTNASTMAIYTHFGGMDGMWRAVRQEGFTRLGGRLAGVERTSDPVHDLMALGAAYVANGLANPSLYRTMFDTVADLEDPDAADANFGLLVACAADARAAGRFDVAADPLAVATRLWVIGHGIVSLVISGALPESALDEHVPPLVTSLFVGAGDVPRRGRRSVTRAWAAR